MHARRSIIRLTTVLFAVIALAGCGGGGDHRDVVARASPSPRPAAHAGPSRPASMPTASSGGVLVDVAGWVRRPGVYRLATGARVHEAIAAAGGAKPGADLAALNRAAPLVDGQQVLVARAGAEPDGGAGGADGSMAVSINRADAAALDELPGIGPVTAARIVSEREASGPFASVDDLDRVPGVGPGTIEALRDVATT
jgi:competence protein ComEA